VIKMPSVPIETAQASVSGEYKDVMVSWWAFLSYFKINGFLTNKCMCFSYNNVHEFTCSIGIAKLER
jgi:hypothetical protein